MTTGEDWAAQVRASYGLNEADEVLVDLAARKMDLIESLPPDAYKEARAQEVILLRALSQLSLPAADGTRKIPVAASAKGKRAAAAKWAQRTGTS